MEDSSHGSDGRRDQIVASALSTLNADPTASMADVAAAAGVGRATLHRYFAGRDDLVREIGERGMARWEASLQASGALDPGPDADADRYRAVLDDLVARYVQDAEDFGFALSNPEVERHPDLAERCARLVELETGVFAAAQRAGAIRDDVPAAWVGHVLFGLLRAGLDARHWGDVAPRRIPELVAGSFSSAVVR